MSCRLAGGQPVRTGREPGCGTRRQQACRPGHRPVDGPDSHAAVVHSGFPRSGLSSAWSCLVVVRAAVLVGYDIGGVFPVDGAGRYGGLHRQRTLADEATRLDIRRIWPATDRRLLRLVVALIHRQLG